ncbi:MAG TPA: ABC transporter substrate-binding protein, partial [Dehalococcoidia bacterium]|nr:ABC transporter substrate-binding protein [Dehalococcoidia bacterium]
MATGNGLGRRNVTRRALLRAAATAAAAMPAAAALACNSRPSAAPGSSSSSGPSEANIKLADAQELLVRIYDEPTGFDPASIFRIEAENVAVNIYSGLTTFDSKSGEPIADLAEHWEIAPDAKTFTFKLRPNAQWQSDYGRVTSADVRYSYERILNPSTRSSYRAELNNVDAIETPDDLTVVIKLKAPDVNFLYQVGNYHQGQIVKREAVEKFGDAYPRNPVGTGPYKLTSWTPNSQMVLEAHDGYFRGKPTLRKVTYRLIKDENAAEVAIRNGEVAVAMNFALNETLQRLAKDTTLVLLKSDAYANNLAVLNLDFKPFSDVRVRQAMAYAVDYASIAKRLAPLTQSPADNLIPPFMPVYTSDVPHYGYNVDKAKELLKAAGYPNGFSVKLLQGGPPDAPTQLRQSMYADAGIKLDFDIVDTAALNRRRGTGEYEIAGRLYPAVNPDTLLFGYLHPDNIVPQGLNGAKYNNATLTAKLEAARAETNVDKRKALYA